MTFKEIENKEEYLKENYPFGNIPELTEKRHCIHCGNDILVGDYQVLIESSGAEFIVCPNAPECTGSVIDWMSTDS